MEVVCFVRLVPVKNIAPERIKIIDDIYYYCQGKIAKTTVDPGANYLEDILECVKGIFQGNDYDYLTYSGLRHLCAPINTNQPLPANATSLEVCFIIQ